MIVELALATHTHPDEWTHTSQEVIATAVDVLRLQAQAMKRR